MHQRKSWKVKTYAIEVTFILEVRVHEEWYIVLFLVIPCAYHTLSLHATDEAGRIRGEKNKKKKEE